MLDYLEHHIYFWVSEHIFFCTFQHFRRPGLVMKFHAYTVQFWFCASINTVLNQYIPEFRIICIKLPHTILIVVLIQRY